MTDAQRERAESLAENILADVQNLIAAGSSPRVLAVYLTKRICEILERPAALAEPHKVSDAQRAAMCQTLFSNGIDDDEWAREIVERLITVIESTDEPAAK